MEYAKKCMIIGAAPITDPHIFQEFKPDEYFVICADGGFETALRFGISPDLIIGDFDSAENAVPDGIPMVRLPVEKDVTDTQAAVMEGFYRGYFSYVLLGCLGGERPDHTFANLNVLVYIAEHGGTGVLADEKTKIFLLTGGGLRLTEMKGQTVSVFPFKSPTCTVTYRGLQYPLQRGVLVTGGTLMGVSNRIVEDEAEIIVHKGMALVMTVAQEHNPD